MSATVDARRASALTNGSRLAACWSASPARASPRADDDLVPVQLRRGGRTLGGSLSWEKPQQLARFSRESPFAGMPVPKDVHVTRQVLAEPDADSPTDLGGARRRHAARHRRARAARADRALPCHRRHALVEPAAVRRLRRHAAAHRRARGHRPRSREQAEAQPRGDRRAADARARRLRRLRDRRRRPPGPCRATSPAAPAPDHPPGFYGPTGRTRRGEHARAGRPAGSARLRRR